MEVGTEALIAFAPVVVAALIVAYVATRFKLTSPGEVLLRYDHVHPETPAKVVRHPGRVIVMPFVHSLARMQDVPRTITGHVDAMTSDGHTASLRFGAVFRVGDGDQAVRDAAAHYLRTDVREVDAVVRDLVASATRRELRTVALADIEPNADTLRETVRSMANTELARSGLVIDTVRVEGVEAGA